MSSTGTKRTAAEAGFDIDALIKNDERAKSKSSTVRSREMQGGVIEPHKLHQLLLSDVPLPDQEVGDAHHVEGEGRGDRVR